mmetsp:Transcript_151196/g.278736  ORF Transcript_151196/g.278736 Transcript_151196/m.278736 type:complete len:86 (-) Transcript_151196:607-864(-)
MTPGVLLCNGGLCDDEQLGPPILGVHLQVHMRQDVASKLELHALPAIAPLDLVRVVGSIQEDDRAEDNGKSRKERRHGKHHPEAK